MLIVNPTDVDTLARVTYMTTSGDVVLPDVFLPADSQTVIDPFSTLGEADFSTKIVSLESVAIAADRTMWWQGPGAAMEGAHGSIGVTGPSTHWYLPEGSTAWGFECWLLIQNPNNNTANCNVTYMIEGGSPVTVPKTIPPKSRRTFDVSEDIGAHDASIEVTSDIPVIPERAMYMDNRRSGHDSIGTTQASNNYYLAEGTTDYGFTTYVLIQNPNPTVANVNVTYMTPTGPFQQPAFQMEPLSRKTIRINDVLPHAEMSTHVNADVSIIAERAMYWDSGAGKACHDTIGVSGPHSSWFLPDGTTSPGFETWTLVQNPNTFPVYIQVGYPPLGGGIPFVYEDMLPAQSRRSYSMENDIGPNQWASIVVDTEVGGGKVIVERTIYGQNRGSGFNTIGGYWDE